MNCMGCNALLKADARLLKCNTCNGCYHFECLNITSQQYFALTAEFKASWKCPSCNNVTRRTRSNLSTPVRSTQIPTHEESMNMSCDILDRSINYSNTSTITTVEPARLEASDAFHAFTKELHNTLQAWRTDMNNTLGSFKEDIKSTLNSWRVEIDDSVRDLSNELKCTLSDIREEISTFRTEHDKLKHNISDITQDVAHLQTSLQFHSDEQDKLKKCIADMNRHSEELSKHNISSLEAKIDSLEQHARQCNVEICNIPETRSENLIHIMDLISNAISFPVAQKEIISVHRVPHAHHQQTNRPKNVIVKLSSRILRDNLLTAFRKVKTVKSDQLGFTGTPTSIYMNEHLTLKKKHLFRKARDAATLHQYKYVWIRNATILVRERDGDTAFAVRTEDDIRKIKSYTNTPNKNVDCPSKL